MGSRSSSSRPCRHWAHWRAAAMVAEQASSELMGEETDSINSAGMIKAMAVLQHKLGPGYQTIKTAFLEPSELMASAADSAKNKAGGKLSVRKQAKQRTVIAASREEDEPDAGAQVSASSLPKGPRDEKTRGIIACALKANFLFRHLDDAGLEEVISTMQPYAVKQADTIIKQVGRGGSVGGG